MKTDIKTCQDTFKISYDVFYESRNEATEVENMFHNRQYSSAQRAILANRGQPAETFNVIKLFGRLILGYYSTVVNTIKVSPTQQNDILTASLLNDVADYTMRSNLMETEGDKIKLDGLLSGMMCCYIDVEDTDEKDSFGRTIRKIHISQVPSHEIAPDPMSKLEDYSDGRFVHRWKWMSEDQVHKMFPDKGEVIKKLHAYENHLDTPESEFESSFNTQFDGKFKIYDNYLIVHTVVTDDDDKVWSIHWCADYELAREEVTFKEVRPYRIHKIHTSSKAEYYGIFREVIESQKAINQALLKIQLMANSQKVFVQDNAVENIEEFTDAINRVNAVIPVKNLGGIKVENIAREVAEQYVIIDRALDRIQRVLGVNDSFLGMAFASDSGRKVKLQQQSTILALRYVTARIEQFYRLLGWDIVNLVKQYYTATQVLRIADESVGDRWIMLNQPQQVWTGQMDANGEPIMDYLYEEVLNPANGEPELDEDGNYIVAPVPTRETEIAFTDVDISIDSVIYNDEDEKNQLLVETVLQGNIGNMLAQVNPGGFMQAAAFAIKTTKTKYSLNISDILLQTAEMLNQGAPPPVPDGQQSPQSQSMSIPRGE